VRVKKSRRMRWAGRVARMKEGRGVYSFLVGKPKRSRSLERPRRRWEDNNKADLQEVGWAYRLHWAARDRNRWRALVNAVMNFGFHKMWGI
jgi:hypothetical protein